MFYSLKDDHICEATDNEQIAQELGLNLHTDKEIVCGYDGKLYFKGEEPVRPETYVDKRMSEYPFLGDQLDMIYWDKVNNTNLWQEKIAEIKTKYPKV